MKIRLYFWLLAVVAASASASAQNVGGQVITPSSGGGSVSASTPGYCGIYSASTTISGYSGCEYQDTQTTTPTQPGVITHGGTPGMTTYGYSLVGHGLFLGQTPASTERQTTTGPATLTAMNTNIIPYVCPATVYAYCDLYRTTSMGTPNTTGVVTAIFVGVTGTGTFTDTGIDANSDGEATPIVNTTNGLHIAGNLLLGAQEPPLGCCDQPGNFSIARTALATGEPSVNEVVVGAGSDNTNYGVLSVYFSFGTVQAPTDLGMSEVKLWEEDYFGYFTSAGGYTLRNGFYGSTHGGVWDEFTVIPAGAQFNIADGQGGTEAGFHTVSSSELEANNGTPVAHSGSLVQLDVATLNMTAIEQDGMAVGSTNAAICWKTTTTLSYCTSVVGAGGACTCH